MIEIKRDDKFHNIWDVALNYKYIGYISLRKEGYAFIHAPIKPHDYYQEHLKGYESLDSLVTAIKVLYE